MSGETNPNINLYRIIHKDNIEYILKNGMFIVNHVNADPNYINIGDNTLIAQRNDYPVGVNPPGGNLGEYIPFYFGPLSPMLLNIKTGYRGITKRPQSDIIYICCGLNSVVSSCSSWCFTDGHAKNLLTTFFNDLKYLDRINWELVRERYWGNTEEDFDRMRKKQAEFLVKEHVSVKCIDRIIVYNDKVQNEIQRTCNKLGLKIPIDINPNNQYYYL